MTDKLQFNVDLPTNTLHGIEHVNERTSLYLGSARIDGNMTEALRQFNLPNAVAPGEWP